MSTVTAHLGLIKPQEGDLYDVGDFNSNMDAIDNQMAATAQALTEMGEQMEALAGEGLSVVKSIQRRTYYIKSGTSTGTCKLSPQVNPQRCLIVFERLEDDTADGCARIDYTLAADSITVSHGNYASYPNVTVGFWVVEFY